MYLLKISLFLAIIALSKCEPEHPAESDVMGIDDDLDTTEDLTDKPVKPASRRFLINKPAPQCMCFQSKPNAKKISDHLSPSPGSKYERLVVYLFRNPQTRDLKIYIPNSEKQGKFPDIHFDNDETLKSIAPTIFDVIFDDIVSVISSWTPVVHGKHQPQKPQPHRPEKPKHSHIFDLNIIKHFNQEKVNSLAQYLKRYRGTKGIFSRLSGVTLIDKLIQLQRLYPTIYLDFINKITKFYPTWLNNGNLIRIKPGQVNNFPYDIKLITGENGKKIVINGEVQPQNNVEEIGVFTPHHNTIQKLLPEINENINMSLDRWLNLVVKVLNRLLKFSSKTIDIEAIKSFVFDILKKHNLAIASNGMLVDSNGRKINLSNIVLRPILLGDSKLVNRVVNNGLYKIPASILFLEAVLVSGQSVKSLGIIPVSHLFAGFHEDSISQITTVQIIETVTVCDGNKCESKKICKNVKGVEEPCLYSANANVNNVNNVHSSSHIIEGRPKSWVQGRSAEPGCQYGCRRSQCAYGSCQNTILLPTDPIIDYFAPASPLPHIILERNGNIVPAESENVSEISDGHEHEADTLEQSDEVKHPMILPGDEEVKIRIVGGNPAVGSGTPVSSKGRSGYIY